MQTLKLIKKYDTYPKYKDSGVEWLGKIPKEWEARKGKFVFQNKKEINKGMKNDNVLSLTMNGVINRDSESNEGLLPSDYQTFQIFEKDDLVFKLIDLENYKTSRVGIVHEKGIMSSAYIRLEANKNYYSRYFFYLYYHMYIQGIYNFLGSGVRSTLNHTDLTNMIIIIPSLEEQEKVVGDLDIKIKEINLIIEKKQKQIELLREKRTAVINNTVINSSGEKGKLKNYIQLNPSKKIVSITNDEDVVSFVPMEAISELGELELQERKYKDVSSGFTYFADGDVVLAKITPCYENGKAGVMKGLKNGFGFGTTEFMVMRPSNKILADYLYNVVFSDKFRKMGEVEMRGTAGQKRVTSSFVMNYELSIPDISTQQKIVDELNKKMKMFDVAITKVEKSIELLQEFKSSLISNIVTGKIKI